MICPIVDLTVEEFERQENKVLYPIQMKLYTNQVIHLTFEYSEFIQYSKLLHQEFQYLTKNQLLKFNKSYFYMKNNQKYIERQYKIQTFCKQLLALPLSIQCSNTFLSFFIMKQQILYGSPVRSPSKLNHLKSVDVLRKLDNENSSVYEQIKFKIVYDANNMIVVRVPRSITLGQLKAKVIQKLSLLNLDLPEDFVFRTIEATNRYSILSTSTTSTLDSNVYDSTYNFDSSLVVSEQRDFLKLMHEKWYSLQKVTLVCTL